MEPSQLCVVRGWVSGLESSGGTALAEAVVGPFVVLEVHPVALALVVDLSDAALEGLSQTDLLLSESLFPRIALLCSPSPRKLSSKQGRSARRQVWVPDGCFRAACWKGTRRGKSKRPTLVAQGQAASKGGPCGPAGPPSENEASQGHSYWLLAARRRASCAGGGRGHAGQGNAPAKQGHLGPRFPDGFRFRPSCSPA